MLRINATCVSFLTMHTSARRTMDSLANPAVASTTTEQAAAHHTQYAELGVELMWAFREEVTSLSPLPLNVLGARNLHSTESLRLTKI